MLWQQAIECMVNKLGRYISGYWKTIVVAGMVLYASLLRDPHFSLPPVAHGDKWAHMLMYALLGGIAWWDSTRCGVKAWWRVLVAVVLPILYGGIIEWVQGRWFYPRTGDWVDWMADAIGVLIGCGIVMAIYAIKDARDDARVAK